MLHVQGALGRLGLAGHKTFMLLSAILFMQFLSAGLVNPLLALQIKALGAEYWQIATVLTTYQLSALASQYYWGRRSDRLGRRKPLVLLGVGGLALAYLGLGTITHFTIAYGIRAFEAVAFAAYNTASLALIGDLLENRQARGRLMGIYRTFGSLSFALAALFGGSLADEWSLRVPFFFASGFLVVAFLLALFIHEDSFARPIATSVAPSDPPSFRLSGVLPFLVVAYAWSLGLGAVVPLWPVYMADLGFAKTDITRLWALAALGEAVLMPLAGHVSDVVNRKVVIAIGVFLAGVVFWLYVAAPVLPWLLGTQLLRAMSFAAYIPVAMIYATELTSQSGRGRAAGVYHSASNLGSITGAALGGTMAQALGMTAMIQVFSAILVGVGAVALRVLPDPSQSRGQPIPAAIGVASSAVGRSPRR